MNYRKILLFTALLALAACRDPGQDVQGVSEGADPSPTNASPLGTAAVQEPAPLPERKTTFASPVAGSITGFPFTYHIAVDREVTNKKTGQRSREVGVEFLDTNVADVNQNVVDQFVQAGFSAASSELQGKAIRSVYTKDGHGDVLVWVRPGAPRGERYALQMPGAKGTIYLAYPLSK